MLGNVACWAFAIVLMFNGLEGLTNDYTRMLFAMGFIFLGTICKAVEVYRETHTYELDVTEDENGRLVINSQKRG